MLCGGCGGHLVPMQRLESIKRIDRKTETELQNEADSMFKASSAESLRCPKCLLPMRKQMTKPPLWEIEMDVCRSCSLVWLDGGELALLQLAHQTQSGFIDAQDLKQRMQTLEASPERKARFEENLAKLPKHKGAFAAAFGEIGEMAAWQIRTRF